VKPFVRTVFVLVLTTLHAGYAAEAGKSGTPREGMRKIDVAGDWSRLPPKDVDPALAETKDPIPRAWSGQKAALRFAEVFMGQRGVRIDWSAAPRANPPLRGDTRSLWKGRGPAKPAVSEPRLFAVGKTGRLFRDQIPATEVLLPAVAVVDGNPEDGFGGYVVGFENDVGWSLECTATSVSVTSASSDARPFVRRFDGNGLAGLQAIARLFASRLAPPSGMSADLWVTVISEWVTDDDKWNCSEDGWRDYLAARLDRRERLLADPRLASTLAHGIVFNTRRSVSWNHCVAQYFGWRQRAGGTLLKLLKPGKSLATEDLIAGRLPRGSFLEPRLSFDAKKIVFAFVETDGPLNPYSMKVNEQGENSHYFHLYTVNADGTDLRQLTNDRYEDFMPCWLPDGDLVFMSTRRRSQSRCFWYGYSNRWQAYCMFRMKPDGSAITQLSWNDVAEWFPTLSADGEILFARWDYIDRDAVRHQNLWSMRQDGTNPEAVWGNETTDPHCTFQPRAIPGSHKIACIASAHHAVTGGPLILIDPTVDANSQVAITRVTPGHYPEIDMKHPAESAARDAHNDWYNSPYPYGEDLFLICWSRAPLQYEPSRPAPDASLGLYILSADGTREVLWRDGYIGAHAPEPLVARTPPPRLQSRCDPQLAAQEKGEVFMSDVYQGLTKAARGTLKRIRVVQLFPRTAPDQYSPLTGQAGHENARAILGTATIEKDGSARFYVPAGCPILFQVLDQDGCAWRTMRSLTHLQPGERVSCVGCHESKHAVSPFAATTSQAMNRPAEELDVPPEGGRPWGFVENVQPILDKKCISCHRDDDPPCGIALTRSIDPRFNLQSEWDAPFSRAYATLCFTDESTGAKTFSNKLFAYWKRRTYKKTDGTVVPMVPCWPEYNQVQTTPEGPGVNALGSGLLHKLSQGKHASRVTPEEKRVIAAWIDLNATFYGRYEKVWLEKQFKGIPVPMPEIF